MRIEGSGGWEGGGGVSLRGPSWRLVGQGSSLSSQWDKLHRDVTRDKHVYHYSRDIHEA